MDDVVVRIAGISKKYYYNGRGPYLALKEVAGNLLQWPWRRLTGAGRVGVERKDAANASFWALDDVSFDIRQGEVIGIIGRNGSGKSTLLKILARITLPSRGTATIRGRVGALLEVGAGFHPELTGRENIFLNGAILGMSRREIRRKFDEIVAFAEVEDFINTPVKYYSSGMYTRLAFSVAAFLETEILLVDEVLAVGDARFQKKCFNLMENLGAAGRTVLLVSHDVSLVTRLCHKAALLSHGRLVRYGPADEVVVAYMQDGTLSSAVRQWPDAGTAPGNASARLSQIRVLGGDGGASQNLDIGEPILLEVTYDVLCPQRKILAGVQLVGPGGALIFMSLEGADARWPDGKPAGRYVSRMLIPAHFLAEGMFSVHCLLFDGDLGNPIGHELDAVTFYVVEGQDGAGAGAREGFTGIWPGVIRPQLDWETVALDRAS